jgi:hypothetical protein
VPHRSRLAAASLLETTAAHRSFLAATRLLAAPHRSLLAAESLLVASLLPPECSGLRTSKLRPYELVLRLQTLQEFEVDA